MSNKLLLDEEPLLIMPQLAVKIGLNESIVLQQIHYWIKINEKADKNFKDGYYWTYNTLDEWQKQFPFWSIRTIQRILKDLKSLKLLVYSNYNKLKIDRTIWYRIDYDVLKSIENTSSPPSGQVVYMDMDKLSTPLPETITETAELKYHKRKKNGEYSDYQMQTIADMAYIELRDKQVVST